MAINIGTDNISEFYIGSDKIGEIYIGSDLVYQSSTDRVIFPPRTTEWTRDGQSTTSYADDTVVVAACNGSSQTNGQMRTVIDFTDYNYLEFDATSSKSGNAFTAITLNKRVYTSLDGATGVANPNGHYRINISNLTGDNTLWLCTWGSTGGARITLSNITLKKE